MSGERRALRSDFALAEDPLLLDASSAGTGGPEAQTAPVWVQILREGQFVRGPERRFELTPKAFEEMVANHKRSGVDPAVDREHESWFSWEATEARGWVRELEVREDPKRPGLAALFGRVEWTDVGATEVRKKYFRYLSGGIHLQDTNRETGEPIGAVLDHLAICKNPFIQGMQPLSLNVPGPGRAQKEVSMSLIEALRKYLGLANADEVAIAKRVDELRPQLEQLAAGGRVLVVTDEALAALGLGRTQLTAETLSVGIVELGRKAKLGEKAAEDLKKQAEQALVAEVDKLIAEFKADPAERDDLLKLARFDLELFRRQTALRKPKAETERVQLGKKPKGADLSKKQDEAIAAFLEKNPQKTYTEALIACRRERPELFPAETSQEEV